MPEAVTAGTSVRFFIGRQTEGGGILSIFRWKCRDRGLVGAQPPGGGAGVVGARPLGRGAAYRPFAPPAGHGGVTYRLSKSRAESQQLHRLCGGRCPANSPGGCRARTRSRRRFLLPARQVRFPLSSRSFGGPRQHGKAQRARATRPIAPLASPRRGAGCRCRRLACTEDGGRHRLVS